MSLIFDNEKLDPVDNKKDINAISRISELTINKCYKKLDSMKLELVPRKILEK